MKLYIVVQYFEKCQKGDSDSPFYKSVSKSEKEGYYGWLEEQRIIGVYETLKSAREEVERLGGKQIAEIKIRTLRK